MRTLVKNKRPLWLVNITGTTDKTDSDGNYTGEVVPTYSTPVKIMIDYLPSNGAVVEQIFGKDYSCDMVAVSNDVVLTKNSLLFYSQPSSNYDKTYDLKVKDIKPSLNTYYYGLVGRP